eukprot:Skav227636  [mRNA]  locus=scaffold58:55135:55686:+ [translate_table: standard]
MAIVDDCSLKPAMVSQELLAEVKKLNDDPQVPRSAALETVTNSHLQVHATGRNWFTGYHFVQVHGILVQLPLPEHISEAAVLKSIRVDKDADGFAAENAARRKGRLL